MSSVRSTVVRAAVGWVLVAALVRTVVLLPEQCPPVSVDGLRAAAAETVGWFERNQAPDGTWLYRYDADADVDEGGYNLVRHAGVTMSLYQAHAHDHEGALDVADRGARHALDSLVPVGDGEAFGPSSGVVPVGASALLVAGLAERRHVTGDDEFDDDLRSLGRFLVAMTKPSGAVVAYWDRDRGAPVSDDPSPFFTGEAYWALALLHRELPDEGWDEAAARIGRYLATERDEVEGWFPDISDHWAAYGLATQAEWPDGPAFPADLARYATRQAGIAGFQVRWESQRTDEWPTTAVRGGRSLGAGLGTLGEQIGGLWRLARTEAALGDPGGDGAALSRIDEPLGARARCLAGMLVERQVSPGEAEGTADPDRTRGAWFQRGITQMDDQQHAMSALLLAEPIVASQPVRVDEPWGGGAPTGLLLAALVLVLNPARAARAVRGDDRRARLRSIGVGALLTAAVLAVVAAAGRPLLDALDVSGPTLRIGAGLVLLLTGLVDLVRPRPDAAPALAGWRAGVVPLAVPALLRPTALVAALSAGVDNGAWVPVVAVVVVAAALAVLPTTPVAAAGEVTVRDTALGWAARLLAALLVVAAVALAVDGIYDV